MHFIFKSDDCDIAITNYFSLKKRGQDICDLSNFLNSRKYITIKNKCLEWLEECIRLKKNEEFELSFPRWVLNDAEMKDSNYHSLGELLWNNCIDYNVCFTKLGLANLEAYIFKKVYETKTNSKVFNAPISIKGDGLFSNQIFFGKNEHERYSLDSLKFWNNFAHEITSKLGNIEFSIITHDYFECFVQTNKENIFIINVESYFGAEEPWYEIRENTFYFEDINVKPIGDNSCKWTPSTRNLYPPSWTISESLYEGLETLQISFNKVLSGTLKKLPSKNDWESFY